MSSYQDPERDLGMAARFVGRGEGTFRMASTEERAFLDAFMDRALDSLHAVLLEVGDDDLTINSSLLLMMAANLAPSFVERYIIGTPMEQAQFAYGALAATVHGICEEKLKDHRRRLGGAQR